jgi:hypothetical protein
VSLRVIPSRLTWKEEATLKCESPFSHQTSLLGWLGISLSWVCLMNCWSPGNPNLLGLGQLHLGWVYHLVSELGSILRRCEWWGHHPLLPVGKDAIISIGPIIVGRRSCESYSYPNLLNLGGESQFKRENRSSPIKPVFWGDWEFSELGVLNKLL